MFQVFSLLVVDFQHEKLTVRSNSSAGLGLSDPNQPNYSHRHFRREISYHKSLPNRPVLNDDRSRKVMRSWKLRVRKMHNRVHIIVGDWALIS